MAAAPFFTISASVYPESSIFLRSDVPYTNAMVSSLIPVRFISCCASFTRAASRRPTFARLFSAIPANVGCRRPARARTSLSSAFPADRALALGSNPPRATSSAISPRFTRCSTVLAAPRLFFCRFSAALYLSFCALVSAACAAATAETRFCWLEVSLTICDGEMGWPGTLGAFAGLDLRALPAPAFRAPPGGAPARAALARKAFSRPFLLFLKRPV